jgi:hypothetical protein
MGRRLNTEETWICTCSTHGRRRQHQPWRLAADVSDATYGKREIAMYRIPSRSAKYLDVRCKRLVSWSWHRGTQESDLIRGWFAEASLIGGQLAWRQSRTPPICSGERV